MAEPRKIELISNGFSTSFDPSNTKDKQPARTQRFCLTLTESTDDFCPEYSYTDLCKNAGNSGDNVSTNIDSSTPCLAGSGSEYESMLLQAQQYEAKYAPKPKKRKRQDRVKDLVDLGDGYDDTDSFVDNSEAYDEYIPCSISTKYGGFYINSGLLDLVPVNDESVDEIPFKKKHKKSRSLLDLDDSRQNQSVLLSNSDGVIKRKRIKEVGSLLGEKRRKYKFGDAIKKSNKTQTVAGILNNMSSPIQPTSSVLPYLKGPYTVHNRIALPPSAQSFTVDDEPLDCSLHPASSYGHSVASGTVNESKPAESIANSARSSVDSAIEAVVSQALQNEQIRDTSLKSDDSQMPLECLTNEFLDMITMLSKIAKQNEDHRIHFFTPEVNRLVIKIDVSIRNLDESVRASVLAYIGGFFAGGCKVLMKQIKKLNPTEGSKDKLKRCILELKELIDRVMPAMMEKYREGLSATEKLKQDRMMDLKEQRDGKPEEDSDEDEDNRAGESGGGSGAEKQKRITNPRRKFEWTQEIRACLCRCVEIKMKRYEIYKDEHKTLDDYLRLFLEEEIKPLWQRGWIHTRILFRESRLAHERWTGGSSTALKNKKLNVFPGKALVQSSAGSGPEKDPLSDTYVQSADISMSATLTQVHSLMNIDDQKTCNKSTAFSSSDVYGARCEPTAVPSSHRVYGAKGEPAAVPLSPQQAVQSTIGSSNISISLLPPSQSQESTKIEASKSLSKLSFPENLGTSQPTHNSILNADNYSQKAVDFKLPAVSDTVASYSPKIQMTQSSSSDIPTGYFTKVHCSQSSTSDIPTGYSTKVQVSQSATSDKLTGFLSKAQVNQSATSDIPGYSSKVHVSQSSTSDKFAGYLSKSQSSQSPRAYDGDSKETNKSASHSKDRSNKLTTNPAMLNLTPEYIANLALFSQLLWPIDGINSAEYLKQFKWDEIIQSFTGQAPISTGIPSRFDSNLGVGGTSSHSRSSTKQERRSRHGHNKSRTCSSSINSSSTSNERRTSSAAPKFSESNMSNLTIGGVSNESCGASAALKSPERMRLFESGVDSNLLQGASIDRRRSFTGSKSPERTKFESVIDSNLSSAGLSERHASFAMPKSPEKLWFESSNVTSKLSSGSSSAVTTDRYQSFAATAPKSPEKMRFELGIESSRSNALNNVGLSESHPSSSTPSQSSFVVSGTTQSNVQNQQQASSVDRYAGWRNLYPEKVRKSKTKSVRDSSQTNANFGNKSNLNATHASTVKQVRSSLNSFNSGAALVTNSSAATGEGTVESRTSGEQHIASAAISAMAQHVSSVNNAVARHQIIHTSLRALGESHASNLGSQSTRQSHGISTSASPASGILSIKNAHTYLSEPTAIATTATKQSQHDMGVAIQNSTSTAVQLQPGHNLINSNNGPAAKQSQQLTSQAVDGHVARASDAAQSQHCVSSVGTSHASVLKKSQYNVSSPSSLSVVYRPFSPANHAAPSSATFLPYQPGSLTVSSNTVSPALATSAPKCYASSVRPTNSVATHSSSLQHLHHPQTLEDQVQAELAATQAAQRRRIETLKTYVTSGSSQGMDLGSKSPRIISGTEDQPKFFLSTSSSNVLLPGAMWRTADLAISTISGTTSNLLTTSLERPTAWATPSVASSCTGLVGGCERTSSLNKVPVSSTGEYHQASGIQTKP